MNEDVKRQNGELLVTATAMSSIAHIVMAELGEIIGRPDLQKLRQATEKKIKNISIEGLTYEQQEALIRQSVARAHHFFEFYDERLGKQP